MAGTPGNASVWAEADIFVTASAATATQITSAATAAAALTTPLTGVAALSAVGLLDGDDGFVEARDQDSNDHYAWGGILVKTSKGKHKRTIQATLLERNAVTFGLLNPGSTYGTPTSGVRENIVKVPSGSDVRAWVFETRDGDKLLRRFARTAELTEVGEQTENEGDLASVQVTITIYPQADKVLYREYESVPA